MNAVKVLVLMLITLLAASMVSAVNLQITEVEINDQERAISTVGDHSENIRVERGETLDIRVWVKALADVDNVQVEADIYGYRYAHRESDKVSATSRTFDLSANDTDKIDLEIEVPTNMDKKYTLLRIRVGDEDGTVLEQQYELHVEGVAEEDAIVIKDVSFSPSKTVNAGRAFTAKIVVKNIGDDVLDDVKVSLSIPELNVKDTSYLDELEADEREELDQFLLRVPDCAEAGMYDAEIVVEFDEYESTTETEVITVLEGDTCVARAAATEKTTVNVPEEQEVNAGSETAYPLMITNQGSVAKAFIVTLSGVEGWGTARLSDTVKIVPAGETKTVYLYVTPNEDADGENVFMATVAADGESEAIALTANVVAGEGTGLKKGLEIALIVLVIILILIGLIIGFNKLRSNEDEETQTYY